MTSLILRYPGAPSVCPAVDGHAGFSGYSHRLAPASRNPGAYCLHHTAPDLLCRPGAHVAAAGGFQCKYVSLCPERCLNRTCAASRFEYALLPSKWLQKADKSCMPSHSLRIPVLQLNMCSTRFHVNTLTHWI